MHRPISPVVAAQLLVLFAERKLELTLVAYEEYFDAMTDLLEKVSNESFRLRDTEAPSESND